MRFIIMHKTNAHWEGGALPDKELLARVGSLLGDLEKAGALLAAEGLRPSSEGVRLRFAGGARTIIAGPFDRGDELPAGFSILRAASIDEAIEWATRQAAIRPTRVAVAGQEVLSADGVAVKASVAATYRISDARRAVLETDDFRTAAYTELQLALRAIVSETKVEDLLQQRAELSTRLKTIPAANLAAIGIELQDAAVRESDVAGRVEEDLLAGGEGASGRARRPRTRSR